MTKAMNYALAAASLAVTLAPATAAASPYRVLVQAAAPANDGPLTNDPAVEYQKGEQAYALGNYESAVRHFERSYELSNLPDLLYNLGMSYQQWFGLSGDINHLRKAKRLFQNYVKRLVENPAMDQSQKAEAEGHITRIDEQIAAEEAKVKPPPPVVEPQTPPSTPPPVDQPARKPVYKRGWFWGVIAGVVVVGAVTAIAVVTTRDPGFEPELGTIRPSAAGLRF